jgi:putative peptidoglycan lipid II flippase
LLTAPAAALLVALAPWILPAISVGALARDAGPTIVAAALGGYGFGLTAYTWSLFTARISYAASDVVTPALAALLGGAAGVAMLGAVAASDGMALVFRVGLAHSLMAVIAAAVTIGVHHRRGVIGVEWRPLVTFSSAAVVAGVIARATADRVGEPTTRPDAIAGLAAGAAIGLLVYAAGAALAGVRFSTLRTALS